MYSLDITVDKPEAMYKPEPSIASKGKVPNKPSGNNNNKTMINKKDILWYRAVHK